MDFEENISSFELYTQLRKWDMEWWKSIYKSILQASETSVELLFNNLYSLSASFWA